MLRYRLIHPDLLGALAEAGHGSQVLLADGNYPVATGAPPSARRVFLNLTPGIVSVTDVLRVLTDAVPVEAARGMLMDSGQEPPIGAEFRRLLAEGTALEWLARFAFYEAARGADTWLVVATGEQRLYANLLLTIGVVQPAGGRT